MSSLSPYILRILTCIMVFSLICVSIPDAHSSSTSGGPVFLDPKEAVHISKKIEYVLAEKGARVAIVFRVGRSPEDLPDGIEFTHGAFWVYSAIPTQEGKIHRGYSVHNLYVNSGDKENIKKSYLHQDFPIDFVLPSALAKFAVIIPAPHVQKGILGLMRDGTYTALHKDDYSLISNPHDPRFQNCNEFILDVISASVWNTDDRMQLKANLKAYFSPRVIAVGGIKRFLAPIFDVRIRTKDHGDTIHTTTYRSMAEFMMEYLLATEHFILTEDTLMRDFQLVDSIEDGAGG